jgi:hypothetical protein
MPTKSTLKLAQYSQEKPRSRVDELYMETLLGGGWLQRTGKISKPMLSFLSPLGSSPRGTWLKRGIETEQRF